jgi:PAS domain S-box-containing protein
MSSRGIPSAETNDEIKAIIETMLASERRLVELTGGEVDAVSDRGGRPFLLRRAQEEQRQSNATKQTAILNALPAHIALLDTQGTIISVNLGWDQFAADHAAHGSKCSVGSNYLEVCDHAAGENAAESRAAANGIRMVLSGCEKQFSLEYPCHSPSVRQWFLMTVVPLGEDKLRGVVVMHLNITDRKLSEEAIEEQQALLRIAGRTAHIGGWTVDTTTMMVRLSEELRTLYEAPAGSSWTITDLIGRHNPACGSLIAAAVEQCALHGIPFDLELEIATGSGRSVAVRAIGEAAHDGQGRIIRIQGSIQDISERKAAESVMTALSLKTDRRERMLSSALSSMSDFAQIFDRRGRLLFVNQPLLNLWGLTIDQVIGRNFRDLSYPDELAEKLQRQISEVFADKIRITDETEYTSPAGVKGIFEYIFSPVFASDGSVDFVVGSTRDITERKLSSEALRSSEKRFKALFEQVAVGVARTDATTGRFVQINQRFCQMLGRSIQELELLTFSAITHPDDRPSSRDVADRLRAGTLREHNAEKRYLRKDGVEVWVSVTISVMWAAGETPDYFLVVAQDITRRKQLEDQFRQAQKMEAIGTLAGGIAHDFNNILLAINGYAELSRIILTGNQPVREHLGAVIQAASRASDLVRQILTFSRQQPVQRLPISLKTVLTETLALLRSTIPSTIEFETSLPADTPTVLADATQVHQIMMNLGTNAWHAMKDDVGRLKVVLEKYVVDENLGAGQPRLRPGVYAHISVSDSGSGMDEATMHRIFEPFFTTKPPGEGTGLGLAVVHGIMDTHDGAVTVYSELGVGTVFHLYFPANEGTVAVPPVESGPAPMGEGQRILFIDDEEMLVYLGERALTVLGYQVESTTEPGKALALIRADPERFALVITDQTMPKMTGLSLARQIQEIRPSLPIILTTGNNQAVAPRAGDGIRQLLLKPFTIESLRRAVHTALAPSIVDSSDHGQNSPH